ncbi:MAG: glycosyltransferase family 4 protein [Deltaproteobacteria bacterium]|nr:glycosyltransferase family 4 protein [Deltaproteobacteria bacterium]
MDIGLIRMKYTPYGGAEVFVSRFIDELLKKGHKCHIFATNWNRDTREAVVLHKIRTFGPSFLRILSFAVNSYFAVRKANLDVILSFDRTFYQDIYRAGDGCHREWLIQRGKLISPLKRFITFLNPLHLIILYLEKRLLKDKRLKFIVANSIRGKDEIKRHYKLPEDKICVIYNGIDIKAFDLIDKNNIRTVYREKLNIKNETTLLFVGSGFERKGLKFLIEALGILKKNGYEGIKLIVVGKGNIAKYKDMSVKCGVEADVKFIGPAKDINPYYCAADIFALPSIYEPFSNACLEAMASGLPVVTSRINGASEILTHGKDGMIINDPVNPEEIAERIKPLLDERARQTAGKEARRTVENYTIGKNVDEFIKLIEKVKCAEGR